MLRVFNCGVGMVLITPEPDKVLALLREMGETPSVIGHVAQAAEPSAKPDLIMQVSPDFRAA
jgi:phosphoribosylformylglycinamidine cyclo-ligase